ncbi:unnamed protein product [Sphagnum tenellum]
MSEHKRKHDSTTDDDNRASLKQELVCKRMVTAEERMMVEEKLRPALGQISGDSFLDIWNREPSLLEEMTFNVAEEVRTYVQTLVLNRAFISILDAGVLTTSPLLDLTFILAEKVAERLSGTSMTGSFGNRDARARVRTLEHSCIVRHGREVKKCWDGRILLLLFWQVPCKDHPRVEPHSQQTLADCTPFKVQIANSSQMPQKVFAGENLKNSDGSPIEVEMIDNRTGSIVLEGLESSAQVTVVVLEGSGENWIEVKPRDGKPPLLAGCVTATLKEGKGRFDTLQITDNSSFVRDKKFRLGFKTQLDSGIQGAFSEAICVKDARGKSNVKKEIPEEDDPVDVLVNIAKDGACSRKLNDNGIKTVKQLVLSYEKDPKGLRNMFEHMAKKSFDATIENAKRSQPVQMAQNQTTISGGAKEGHAVISVQKDVSGLLMSGDHSKFNVLENQHNLSLGHPQGDHLNPLAGLAMSSHSGEPGVVLQSLAFQPRVDTDCLNETAFPIDEMLLNSGTFFDPSWPSWGAVDFSAGSN